MFVKVKITKSIAKGLMCGAAFTALTPMMSLAQDANDKHFNIDPQNLSGALTQFSIQSGVEVLFNGTDVKDKASQTLTGTMSPAAALGVLLAETDVSYFQNSDGTFIIGETHRSKVLTDAPRVEKQVQLNNASVNSSNDVSENVEVETEAPSTEDVNITDAFKEDASLEEEDEIVAIGSRISGANDTQRVTIIDFEELRASGVSTVEEAFRNVLQNFSSTNAFSNAGNDDREFDLALGTVPDGVSSINLRGLGSANTLVLLNGRRVAGVAGSVDNFANVSNIPLSAVERIEILPDGASAAYGSDAIGGVVNIVLRKDFKGLTVGARYENSSTDADSRQLDATYGTTWKSGRLTASASYNERDRINSRKAGYTTNFYPGVFNDGSDLDTRVRSPRTGVFFGRALPNDNDGTTPVTFGASVPSVTINETFDLVPEFVGADSERVSFSLGLTQEIASNIEFFANGTYTQNETFRDSVLGATPSIPVPASNAFNGLGFQVGVMRFPIQEFEDGLIEAPQFTTNQKQLNLTGGFNWSLSNTASFEIAGGYSRSSADILQENILNLSPEALAVLESSDPDVAVNLFGNGVGQNPEAIAALYGNVESSSPISELYSLEPVLKFEALNLGGGNAKWVFGGEYREEGLKRSDTLSNGTLGLRDNGREILGLFGEVYLPFVDEKNASFGMHSFSLSLQARYDRYSSSGQFGEDDAGQPIAADVSFDNVSPRIGVAYSPTEALKLRGSFGESFRAPTATDLFSTRQTAFRSFTLDPFDPSIMPGDPPVFRIINITNQNGNPDILPETSKTFSLGFNYQPSYLDGLDIDVSWSKTNFDNRIVNTSILSFTLLPEVFLSIPDVAERDAAGNLVQLNHRTINLLSRDVENIEGSVSYNLETEDYGDFEFDIAGTYFLELSEQISAEFEPEDTLGTSRGPVEYSLQGHVGWQKDSYGLDAFVRFTPSHINDFSVSPDPFAGGTRRRIIDVDSYTTFDLNGYYNFDDYDLRLSAGVRNLFNADFPLSTIGSVPYDAARVDPRGRIFNIGVSKTF